jgi:hypothetical protein
MDQLGNAEALTLSSYHCCGELTMPWAMEQSLAQRLMTVNSDMSCWCTLDVGKGLNPLPPGHQPPQMIPAHVRVRLLDHPAEPRKGEETD